MRFSFDTSIERGDEEFDVRVVYEVTPGCPAQIYGDYPHPSEPPSVEVISIRRDGQHFTTTDEEDERIFEQCEERAGSDMADEAAEAAEWRAQERRDRLLMGDL